jgi:hypothetical protein
MAHPFADGPPANQCALLLPSTQRPIAAISASVHPRRRPAQRSPKARLALLCALLTLGLSLPSQAALRLLLLVSGQEERKIATRAEGQLADLDVTTSVELFQPAPELAEQRVEALGRCQDAGADAVAWFGTEGGARFVYLAQEGRFFSRGVPPSVGPVSTSASEEAAALVLRTAVRGLLAGALWAPAPLFEPPAASPAPPTLSGWGAAAWLFQLDGQRSGGRHGIALSGGLARGPWRAGLFLHFSPPLALATDATYDVTRLAAGASLSYALVSQQSWRASASLRLAAEAFLHSSSGATALPGLVPAQTHDASPSLHLGAGLEARLSRSLWLELEAGATLLFQPPSFGVETSAGFLESSALHTLSPTLRLGLLYGD